MASFNVALAWTLDNWEDPSHEYKKDPDAPLGAFAIAGINSVAWPEDFAAINATPQADRAVPVAAFYSKHFWTSWLAALTSDEVAKRVFDAGVNMGSGTAAKMIQAAVNACGGSLAVDGQLGPASLVVVNGCDPVAVVDAFKQQRANHYRKIVTLNPSNQKYLAGWLERAQA